MGNADTKLNFRKAVIQLTTKTQPIEASDEAFWEQFWSDSVTCVQDVFTLIPAAEIRALREESPSNLATLCYKAVEQLVAAAEGGCHAQKEQQTALNCIRLLTRVLPYIFEDPDWRGFFWSKLPGQSEETETSRLTREIPPSCDILLYKETEGHGVSVMELTCIYSSLSEGIWSIVLQKFKGRERLESQSQQIVTCMSLHLKNMPIASVVGDTVMALPLLKFFKDESPPLAQSLLNAIGDLLFCPDFTVASSRKSGPDNPEDMGSIDSCEYIWEAGVGFAHSPPHNVSHDLHRTEILKLLMTCFSETMYLPPVADAHAQPNQWIHFFTSTENRHALPLFTSLLNIVCAYDPIGYGVPYNHLMFTDSREPLVEVALQVLCVTMEHETANQNVSVDGTAGGTAMDQQGDSGGPDNLFVNYLSRIHREEDFHFILKGITRLLNNPLMQTYLPGSCKRIQFHQELLVLFWKMCDINKKFMFYVLKSSDVLDILVPILYFLNDARADQSRVGLMHIGVFILLLLSGERNFGVRLNKPYSVRVPMDIPVFTGTHADFLIIVFHKIITTGHQRLQPLFDCLLTIIVNVSPYLKTLSMVASTKLLHLLEAFSTSWFLYASPTNHHLVFFLLEVFNNIIQYQFDGNSNLVYTIIRKRNVFHQLANLPTDHSSIAKALTKRSKKLTQPSPDHKEPETMEGAIPAAEAEPGTLKASLAATPRLDKMTEKGPPDDTLEEPTLKELASSTGTHNVQPPNEIQDPMADQRGIEQEKLQRAQSLPTPPSSPTLTSSPTDATGKPPLKRAGSTTSAGGNWVASPEWVHSWKQKLPLQTIMRMLQVLVPQVEKICIDKGLTDESEILKFLQHGTLVGLLPVPHPILIRKYQANSGTTMWFRTYLWGVIYLRNVDPPVWYDTNVKLFEIQRV